MDSLPVHFGRGGGGGRGRGRGRWNNNNRGGRGRGRGYHRGGGRGWNNHRGGGRGRGRGGGGRRENEIFQEIGTPSESSVRIAVEGCCHGELDAIYARIKDYEQQQNCTVDLLICCGDFQSLRTHADFHNFAAPPKYRRLGSFVKYYSGAAVPPMLTLFVGGNHENSQSLQELYYGGWVAPNIYYVGAAGVVQFKGIRIGGISGIYKSHDYRKGHFERPPYTPSTLRSVYHVRNLEVHRMKCLEKERRLDVMVSHDWPQGIEAHGNTNELIRRKPFFLNEVKTNTLGSPANREILEDLKPKHWFAAHLHVGFRATLNHSSTEPTEKETSTSVTSLVPSQTVKASPSSDAKKEKPNDTTANDHADSTETATEDQMKFCQPVAKEASKEQSTTFISLDKCMPGKAYLSIANIQTDSDASQNAELEYDPEWLAILRKTHSLTQPSDRRQVLPDDTTSVSSEEVDWVKQKLLSRTDKDMAGSLRIPKNFNATVPPPTMDPRVLPRPLPFMGNPQTDEFLELLELDHILTIPYDPSCLGGPANVVADENEIDIDDAEGVITKKDENEIDIEEDSNGEGNGQGDDNEIDIDEVDNGGGDEEEGKKDSHHDGDADASNPKRPRLEGDS